MDIEIRWISHEYCEITVEQDDHLVKSCLLDADERLELARKFISIADDLLTK